MLVYKRVEDDSSLLSLMSIRNEVRSFMTGSQELITWEQQRKWFEYLDHSLIKIWLYGTDFNNWIGYGQLRIEPGAPVYGVSSHAVTADCRGKGYGEEILKDIIVHAKEYGCNAMRAEIFKDNAASLGLVYKLGYKNTKDMGDVWEVQLPL